MSGSPVNRAQTATQHFSVAGIQSQLVRELRVHAILDNSPMGELVNQALKMYLDTRKGVTPKGDKSR